MWNKKSDQTFFQVCKHKYGNYARGIQLFLCACLVNLTWQQNIQWKWRLLCFGLAGQLTGPTLAHRFLISSWWLFQILPLLRHHHMCHAFSASGYILMQFLQHLVELRAAKIGKAHMLIPQRLNERWWSCWWPRWCASLQPWAWSEGRAPSSDRAVAVACRLSASAVGLFCRVTNVCNNKWKRCAMYIGIEWSNRNECSVNKERVSTFQ